MSEAVPILLPVRLAGHRWTSLEQIQIGAMNQESFRVLEADAHAARQRGDFVTSDDLRARFARWGQRLCNYPAKSVAWPSCLASTILSYARPEDRRALGLT